LASPSTDRGAHHGSAFGVDLRGDPRRRLRGRVPDARARAATRIPLGRDRRARDAPRPHAAARGRGAVSDSDPLAAPAAPVPGAPGPGAPGPAASAGAAVPGVRGIDLVRVESRALYIQALFSAERQQGPGFAFALLPVLRRVYTTAAERGRALARHMGSFGPHPV